MAQTIHRAELLRARGPDESRPSKQTQTDSPGRHRFPGVRRLSAHVYASRLVPGQNPDATEGRDAATREKGRGEKAAASISEGSNNRRSRRPDS